MTRRSHAASFLLQNPSAMFTFLLITQAHAGPFRVANAIPAGTSVAEVAVASDLDSVAFVETGSDKVWVLWRGDWKASAIEACSDQRGIAAIPGGFAVGCNDGSVALIDVRSGRPSLRETFPVGTGAVLGMTGFSGKVYPVVENKQPGGYPQMVELDPIELTLTEGGWPLTLGYAAFQDVAAAFGTSLVVAHGGDFVSSVDPAIPTVVLRKSALVGADCADVSGHTNTALLACGFGVVEFQSGTGALSLLLGGTEGLTDTTALWFDANDEQLWVADTVTGVTLFEIDDLSGLPTTNVLESLNIERTINEIDGFDGYGFLGSADGELLVVTHNPWVTANVTPESAQVGTELTLTFSSDIDGDYDVLVGEGVVTSGTTKAKQEQSVTVTVDNSFVEGRNLVSVQVVDRDGDVGQGGGSVLVDNPPDKVQLDASSVLWGDGSLTLEFPGNTDEDLASYQVYLSTTSFSAGDYPTGGPTFDGNTNVDLSPVAATPGEDPSIELSPLNNGVTYYMAVRAIDEGGLESEMSDVVTGTPQASFTASELSGEEGFGCATPAGAATLGGLILAMGALARRRRMGQVASLVGVVALTGMMMFSPTALAGDWRRNGIEAKFGSIWYEDNDGGGNSNALRTVYGETGNNILWLNGGPTISDVLVLDLGVGRTMKRATTVNAAGDSSGEDSVFTAYPVTIGAQLRLDVIKEQWIVPVGSVGFDYWLWSEKSEYSADDYNWKNRRTGGMRGYHFALGAQILLDAFQPGRASLLTARSGIEDTFLVIEARRQEIENNSDPNDGFVMLLSGNQVTAGLRFAY